MQTLQTGVDRNLAEVEALREQYESHRALCKKNKAESIKMLGLLQRDMPIAKNLTDFSTMSCKLPTPVVPALTECSLPNGEFVTTFKNSVFRNMISNCSGITEKVAALNLDRAVRARVTGAAKAKSLVQLQSRRLRGSSSEEHHEKKHHRRKSKKATAATEQGIGLLQRYVAHREVPKAWCTDVSPPPACEAITDSMYTFLGNVEDLTRDLLGKSQSQEEQCQNSLQTYEEQVKAFRREADDGSVALANAAAEHTELAALRRERRVQVQDLTRDAEKQVATCGQQMHDLDDAMCGASKLKKDMGAVAGKGIFMGDCEVGDWVRGSCSQSCGDKGEQTLTRSVISSKGPKALCPSLKLVRPCNRRACPVDGKMGHWEPWSGCSRACGGGTRSRHRRVISLAQHGGLPTAETMQEQLCNTQPCDQDCFLSDWTPWTNCTKLCNRGHKSRARKALRPPLGEGTCPDEKSPLRLQSEPCGRTACEKLLPNVKAKCSGKLDVALVVDVSGSVGAISTEKLKLFVTSIAERMELSSKNAQLGLVYYGSTASVASPLTSASADLLKSVATVTWQKDGTNTAQALGLARSLFEDKGRPTAKQVVIVVTDGMPQSAFLTGVEVARLKESNTRLSFVAIGKSVSRHVLQRWASWPWEENVVGADTFGELDDKKVTEVLANICGSDFA